MNSENTSGNILQKIVQLEEEFDKYDTTVNAEIERLKNEIEQKNMNSEEIQLRMNEQLSNLQLESAELIQKNASLLLELDTVQTADLNHVTEMQDIMNTLQLNLADMSNDANVLIEGLNKDVESLQSKLTKVTDESTAKLLESTDSYIAETTSLKNQILELQTELQQENENTEGLNKKLQQALEEQDENELIFKSAIENLELTTINNSKEISTLNKQLLEKIDQIYEKNKTIEQNKDAIKILTDVKTRMESQIEEYEKNKTQNEADIEKANANIDDVLERMNIAETMIVSTSGDLNKCNAELADAIRKLEELQTKINSKRDTLTNGSVAPAPGQEKTGGNKTMKNGSMHGKKMYRKTKKEKYIYTKR